MGNLLELIQSNLTQNYFCAYRQFIIIETFWKLLYIYIKDHSTYMCINGPLVFMVSLITSIDEHILTLCELMKQNHQ